MSFHITHYALLRSINICLQNNLDGNVHVNFIQNSQNPETTQIPTTDKWVNYNTFIKLNYATIRVNYGYMQSRDESQKHAKWKNRHATLCSIWFHLYDRNKNFRDRKNDQLLPGARKGSRRGLTSKMDEKKVFGIRNVLYLDCCSRFRTVYINQNLPNYTV